MIVLSVLTIAIAFRSGASGERIRLLFWTGGTRPDAFTPVSLPRLSQHPFVHAEMLRKSRPCPRV